MIHRKLKSMLMTEANLLGLEMARDMASREVIYENMYDLNRFLDKVEIAFKRPRFLMPDKPMIKGHALIGF